MDLKFMAIAPPLRRYMEHKSALLALLCILTLMGVSFWTYQWLTDEMSANPALRELKLQWAQRFHQGDMNLALVKVHKAAGSTLAGVLRHLGGEYGLHEAVGGPGIPAGAEYHQEPAVFAYHMRARQLFRIIEGLELPTFRLTIIHEPADRALSQFYFDWRKKGLPMAVADKIEYLRSVADAQFHYIRPSLWASLSHTLASYDLIGTRDRLPETLLLLKFKLQLSLADVLYLSAKVAATNDVVQGFALIRRPALAAEEPAVREYLVSEDWYDANRDDLELFRLVNARLDAEVAFHGEVFQEELGRYRYLLQQLDATCRLPMSQSASQSDCGFEAADCECFRAFLRKYGKS